MVAPPDGGRQFYAIADGSPACGHDALVELEGGGGGLFFRCPDCGSVVVREGPAREHPGRSGTLEGMDPRMGDLLEDIDAYHAGEQTSYTEGLPRSITGRVVDAWRRLLA